MKLTGRAAQRGIPLDDDCKIAKVSTHEYGQKDNRKFCYGLYDMSTLEVMKKCIICGAYSRNAKPLEN